jgi:predicted alternative tryptophan synthase beta-subunit
MKNKQFLTVSLLFFLTCGIVPAQESSSELKLSLKEAQNYAIQHNKMVISAKMVYLR